MDPQVTEAAERAAEKAIRDTFRLLGVDTHDQDSVNEFRADLIFARDLRRTTKTVQSRILYVAIGVLTLAVLAALSKGFGWKGGL